MEKINAQMKCLMEQWKETHQKNNLLGFISDGIVDIEAYLNSKNKICFFFKEAYSKDSKEDWDLTEWLSNGAMTKMWGTVAEWIYAIKHTTTTSIPVKMDITKA